MMTNLLPTDRAKIERRIARRKDELVLQSGATANLARAAQRAADKVAVSRERAARLADEITALEAGLRLLS